MNTKNWKEIPLHHIDRTHRDGEYVKNPSNVKNKYLLIPAGTIIRERKSVSFPHDDGFYMVQENSGHGSSKKNIMNDSEIFSTGNIYYGEHRPFTEKQAVDAIIKQTLRKAKINIKKTKSELVEEGNAAAEVFGALESYSDKVLGRPKNYRSSKQMSCREDMFRREIFEREILKAEAQHKGF